VSVEEICRRAREASLQLAMLPRLRKDEALTRMADALLRRRDEIMSDNSEDVAAARADRLPDVLVDRLLFDEQRMEDAVNAVYAAVSQADPVGQTARGWRLANGMEVREVRVPLGVVAVVYESRPHVTVDAAALCVKAGNAVVLRGGVAAKRTNRILAEVIEGATIEAGLPKGAVSHLSTDRDELLSLLHQSDTVDVVIPRGGSELHDYVQAHSSVPVLYATAGRCHIYIDAAADVAKAVKVCVNARCQRPGAGNSVHTLLVHGSIARRFLPAVLKELGNRGVEIYADKATLDLAGDETRLKRASRSHYEAEFVGTKLAIRVVSSLDEALEHIREFGNGHSEAILTENLAAAREFSARADSGCVYVNASTRFTDGTVFGLAGDLGVSTQKLHARGPLGLRELTCGKYVVWGEGNVRM
jgi:glutamate-5-semialdehyde dehydrogenase